MSSALETAFAILRATMERPLGLICVLMFLGGIAAFLVLRDLNPKASVTSFWFVFIGCLGLAYEASETMRLNPDLTRFRRAALTAPSPDARPIAPSPTARTHVVRPNSGKPLPGESTPPPPSPGGATTSGSASSTGVGVAQPNGTGGGSKSNGTSTATGGQDGSSGSPDGTDSEKPTIFSSIRWVTERIVTEERVTGNHKCSDVPGAANPMACKTGYVIALSCDADKRLTAPQLHCLEGDCAAAKIGDISISPDGRRVDARFEVWGAPTRWQLTAVREQSVTPSP